jgi:general secretion pathway protein I
MSASRFRRPRGFTLLEIMVAVAILGLGLTAILSAQAGAFASAAHARHISQATGLIRCKMLEVEEDTLRNGFQASDVAADGPCCDGDDTVPMHCAWRVEAPVMPTPEYGQMDLSSALDPSSLGPLAALMQPGGAKDMFGTGSNVTDIAQQLFGSSGAPPPDVAAMLPGASASSGSGATVPLDGGAGLLTDPNAPPVPGGPSANPMDQISGIVMGMVYPDLKTYFEASTRRVTVDLTWREGKKEYTLTLEQWIAQPQQGLPDDTDDPTADTTTDTGTGHPHHAQHEGQNSHEKPPLTHGLGPGIGPHPLPGGHRP